MYCCTSCCSCRSPTCCKKGSAFVWGKTKEEICIDTLQPPSLSLPFGKDNKSEGGNITSPEIWFYIAGGKKKPSSNNQEPSSHRVRRTLRCLLSSNCYPTDGKLWKSPVTSSVKSYPLFFFLFIKTWRHLRLSRCFVLSKIKFLSH